MSKDQTPKPVGMICASALPSALQWMGDLHDQLAGVPLKGAIRGMQGPYWGLGSEFKVFWGEFLGLKAGWASVSGFHTAILRSSKPQEHGSI